MNARSVGKLLVKMQGSASIAGLISGSDGMIDSKIYKLIPNTSPVAVAMYGIKPTGYSCSECGKFIDKRIMRKPHECRECTECHAVFKGIAEYNGLTDKYE